MSVESHISNFTRRKSILAKKLSIDENIERISKRRIPSGIRYMLAWITYVLIGSYIFLLLETSTKDIVVHVEKWIRFKDIVVGDQNQSLSDITRIREYLMELCPHPLFTKSIDEFRGGIIDGNSTQRLENDELRNRMSKDWLKKIENDCGTNLTTTEKILRYTDHSMVDAIYYTMTLVTTIGFGHISPTTDGGKLFCIPYALVGVPLTCILLAKSSEILSSKMLLLYETIRKRYKKHQKILLVIVTWLFLVAGCFTFMFLPSLIFATLENWTYIDAFYFSFITLSTIGFGDFIAGYDKTVQLSDLYKMLIVIWIMISLGYWIFLLNFLQKAIKSNAKAIKKTFIKSKNLSKQAEFLKNIISKVSREINSLQVRQTDNEPNEGDYNEKLRILTVIVESLTTSDKEPKNERKASFVERKKSNFTLPTKSYDIDHDDHLDLLTAMVEVLAHSNSRRILESHSSVHMSSGHSCPSLSSYKDDCNGLENCNSKPLEESSSLNFDKLMNMKVHIDNNTATELSALLNNVILSEESFKDLALSSSSELASHIDFNVDSFCVKDICKIASVVSNFESDIKDSKEGMNNVCFVDEKSENSSTEITFLKKLLLSSGARNPHTTHSCPEKCNSENESSPHSLQIYLENQGDTCCEDQESMDDSKIKNKVIHRT